MAITDDLSINLMRNCKTHGDLIEENSFLSQLFRTTLGSTQQSDMTEQHDTNNGKVAIHLQD